MLKKMLYPLLFLLFPISSLFGQGASGDPDYLEDLPAAEKGDLLCRCVSTFPSKKRETFYFKIGETYYEVALTGEGVSRTFPVRGTKTFTLYNKVVSEEGEVAYIPVVEQVLSGSGENHLIILSRMEGKDTLKSKSIDLSKYRADHIYLFNECPATIGLDVNDTQAVVKPFGTHTHNCKGVGRNAYTSAKVVMRYEGENKVMAGKRLRLVPGRRIIMVCFPSKARAKMGATPLKLFTLQDMP